MSFANGSRGRGARLLANTAVFSVGKLLSKLLVFFMTRLYTACLTPAEYSTADLIVNAANLIIPLACVGISEGIFRNAADRSADKEAYFTNGLLVLGLGSLAFLALSPLIGLVPMLHGSVWLIVLYVLSANLHAVVSQYLCAIGRTKLFAAQGLLNTALVVGLNILFLPVLGLGVEGFVLSVIMADALTTLFLFFVTRLWRAVRPRTISGSIVRSMLAFCLPLVPTIIFWWITGVSDRYMVAAMVSEEVNGLYTAAYKIPTLLIYVVSIFDSAWKLSVASESDPEETRRFYSRVWRIYTAVAFIGGGALMLSCRLFANVLFADGYASAWIYIPLLTTATVFTALDTFLGSVYFAGRKTAWSMITAFVGALLNVALNLILIPVWGAMGASFATFVSYFAVFVLRLVTTHRLIPFERGILRGVCNTVALGLMTVAVTFAEGDHGAVMWGLAGVAYAAILLFNARAVLEILKDARRMIRNR